jgi:ElaB/YqjD/DUF883 family membrane-anchored ribosome-binding protein
MLRIIPPAFTIPAGAQGTRSRVRRTIAVTDRFIASPTLGYMMRVFGSGGDMGKETPFDRARDFVEEKIDQTKDVLGDSYSRARDQFDDVSEDVRKNLKKSARHLEKEYGPLWEDVRKYVRENPGTALAISLGVGFFFGILSRGGDD